LLCEVESGSAQPDCRGLAGDLFEVHEQPGADLCQAPDELLHLLGVGEVRSHRVDRVGIGLALVVQCHGEQGDRTMNSLTVRHQASIADRPGAGPSTATTVDGMCGRFVSTAPVEEIAEFFQARVTEETALEPSYNVAPTNDVYAVLSSDGVRRVEALHWGLVPFWAKEPSIGNKMINARAETLATKNAYRNAYKKKRCLIPATGFYEWAKVPGEKRKQPMFIHRVDGQLIPFAGLWEVWRNPEDNDDELHSCTIITGRPNETVATIHDRMPVMLPPAAWDTWLDPDIHDVALLDELLVPAPAELIELYPVSTDVNNVRNKGAHLSERAAPILDLEPLGLSHLGRPAGGAQGVLV